MPNHNNPAARKMEGSGAQPEAYSTMEPYYSEYSRMLRVPGEKEDSINVKNMKWAESYMAKLTLAPGVVQDATVMVEMDVVSGMDERKSQHPAATDADGDIEMSLPEEIEFSSRRKRKASHESGDSDIEINAPPCKK
uniref:Uncharacterized protein n=1 Tax=Moniliophthora roreri TaxID=221103 RepID=A0A0W0FHT4_MONRR